MNNLAIPTGEQHINPLIIILIIVAGLLLIATIFYPYLPRIKNKFNSKKDENNENLD